jgi:hypothetical protein
MRPPSDVGCQFQPTCEETKMGSCDELFAADTSAGDCARAADLGRAVGAEAGAGRCGGYAPRTFAGSRASSRDRTAFIRPTTTANAARYRGIRDRALALSGRCARRALSNASYRTRDNSRSQQARHDTAAGKPRPVTPRLTSMSRQPGCGLSQATAQRMILRIAHPSPAQTPPLPIPRSSH